MWFLFSHLDLEGRSEKKEVFVTFLLVALSEARFFLSHGGAARPIPLRIISKTQAAPEFTFKSCEPALKNVINHQ